MKRTLELSEQQAKQLYPNASQEFKTLLEENFGKKIFITEITDRVKTYEDACIEIGEIPINESDFLAKGFTPDEIIYRKLKIITKALNEGWKPNMTDTDQKKWFPIYAVNGGSPSGFVFDDSYYCYSLADAGDASRLCFKSESLSDYAGKQFIDLYLKFIK